MYSVVLMAALGSGLNAPDFHFHKAPVVAGCTGCQGGVACYGMPMGVQPPVGCGGVPYPAAFGTGTSYSYYGTCDGGGWGVGRSWMNHVPVLPPLPPTNTTDPKTEPEKPEFNLEKYWFGFPPADPEMLNPPSKEPEKDKNKEVDARRAKVIVHLPKDAKLFIDDAPTKATSDVRSFRTPALEKAQTYYYLLRAEFEVEGRPTVLTKRIALKAGEETRAYFDDPRSVASSNGK